MLKVWVVLRPAMPLKSVAVATALLIGQILGIGFDTEYELATLKIGADLSAGGEATESLND